MLPMIAEARRPVPTGRLLYGGPQRGVDGLPRRAGAYGDRVTVLPRDEVALMLDRARRAHRHPAAGHPRVHCGPEGLLAAVEARCATWPAGVLHLERFAAKADRRRRSTTELRAGAGAVGHHHHRASRPLDLRRRPGRTASASSAPATRAICGTCETVVLDGEVDHRDSVLNDEEKASNETMMICVSRCTSDRLTLDL